MGKGEYHYPIKSRIEQRTSWNMADMAKAITTETP